MMIYITVFRCIYVKVINYTYFLIHFFFFFNDKTSGARPLKCIDDTIYYIIQLIAK